MKKIIFVCTGNTCRSPMAEQLLKHKLKEKKISSKIIEVVSAGVNASEGEPIAENAIIALKKLGVKPVKQKSKQLKQKMVNENTVLITLTKAHKEWIKNLPNVYSFSDFDSGMDVPDPYGGDIEDYLVTANLINFVVDEILEKALSGEI